MKAIPDSSLSKIQGIIEKYSLINSKEVFVTYSGGKDSLFLCLALQQLGYKVFSIIIDIGYNSDWTNAIETARNNNFDVLLLNNDFLEKNCPDIITDVKRLFMCVVDISKGNYQTATICTPCYNAKMTILRRWAESNKVSQIAMGHHGTDAISSMLKSFYYYIDRWQNNNKTFNYERYRTLINSQSDKYSLPLNDYLKTDICSQLNNLIERGFVGTDEPIVQRITDSSVKLIRPMYGIYENEIINYYNNILLNEGKNIFASKTTRTECFITNYRKADYMTPRELIQFNLLSSANVELMNYLLKKSTEGLDEQGFLKYNVRNNRSKILGSTYKDSHETMKKL